ncbi:MAG: KpsF/GutQ family sugar-phosphate isomerase [Candidatus Kapaibacteriota bacterium]
MTTFPMTTTNILLHEAQRIVKDEQRALMHLTERFDEERFADAFAKALDLLAAAQTILVFGIGKSGIVGQKIAATLTSTGSRAISVHPVEALHGDIGIATKGDVALLLSKSGTTAELLALLPSLTVRAIPTIGLLGAVDSPLGTLCDCVLDVSVTKEACPLGLAPMSSTTVAMALGDALAGALMKQRGFRAEDFASVHASGQLGKNLTLRVADVMHTGAAIPAVAEGASFREALMENSRKGLGCVCVVQSLDSMQLLGIITDGDIRRALEHFDDIRTLPAKQVMTRSPLSTSPQALLGEALAEMERRDRQISVLPIVDAEKCCVGVLRVHDIVRAGL